VLRKSEAPSGRANARSELVCFCNCSSKIKSPGLELELGLLHFREMFYFTLAKMITSVYNAKDSIRARPRISAS
jgi:hypothetical protein